MTNEQLCQALFAALASRDDSTATGFVEEHAVRGTLADGTALDLAVCVVGDVQDGKITAVREYLDGVAAAALMGALG